MVSIYVRLLYFINCYIFKDINQKQTLDTGNLVFIEDSHNVYI